MTPKVKTESTVITIRIPKSLLERLDKAVKDSAPKYRDRTHLIVIALTDYLSKPK